MSEDKKKKPVIIPLPKPKKRNDLNPKTPPKRT
jgi:hypothetical protein